jgi:uncharacterized protein YcbK (DUF882 family)
VHVVNARLNTRRLFAARAGYSCGLALLAFLFGSKALQNAVAEGDTRTISLHHIHTDEDITVTFKRDGRYDDAALEKLNWFLRDWRRSEQTRMDPHLIDLVWEVQREAGSKDTIQVVCGYRSPQTNAMLRHHSSGVARYSQHMLGHAMDFYVPGVPLEQLREYGLRLQRGGVGFYPESGSPFVHMDTAGIRMWPRMTHQELARVFPDGRTVHVPSDGRPLSGYALALADITKRGGAPSQNSLDAARNAGIDLTVVASNDRPRANPFARLLGLGKDEDDEDSDSGASSNSASSAPPNHPALAALAHDAKAAENVAAKAATKVADAVSKTRLIHVAALAQPAPRPVQPASTAQAALSPNQIIVSRGYWQGPADATTATTPSVVQVSLRGTEVASADTGATGSISPFAQDDHTAPAVTLAYADPAPTGIDALRAAAAPVPQGAVNGTTVAVKRVATQVASAIMTASASSVTVIKSGVHLDSPWLRAVVLSPSVHRFLTTMALGERDFRSLAALMVKPANSVMMTFTADPNAGLQHDHFSGAAIVFVSTVTYPTRTASLR